MDEEKLLNYVLKTVPKHTKICPICGYVGKFDEAGVEKKRPAALCPNCKSNERTRLHWLFLNENDLEKDALSVAHIMPEQAIRFKIKSKTDIDYCVGGMNDVSVLLSGQKQYDIIIANNVADRIENRDLFLHAVFDSLKKEGYALLTINATKETNLNNERNSKNQSTSFFDALTGLGFHVEYIKGYDFISPTLCYIFGIGSSDYLIVVHKYD